MLLTLKRTDPPPEIPSSPEVKYLGITFDKRLTLLFPLYYIEKPSTTDYTYFVQF